MRHVLIALVALALIGCKREAARPTPTPPHIVEVAKVTYAPMPHELTDPLPEPALPPKRCAWNGLPAWCLRDALAWIEEWRTVHDEANSDRAQTRAIGEAAVRAVEP